MHKALARPSPRLVQENLTRYAAATAKPMAMHVKQLRQAFLSTIRVNAHHQPLKPAAG
jgi:hypothetical protein